MNGRKYLMVKEGNIRSTVNLYNFQKKMVKCRAEYLFTFQTLNWNRISSFIRQKFSRLQLEYLSLFMNLILKSLLK